MDRDELYQTVLEGLAHYLEDPFVADVSHALSRFPLPRLALSLNKNQLRSKRWLLRELRRVHPGPLGTVYVLGGWYGVLAAMLLADEHMEADRVVSFDLDAECEDVASALNHRHVAENRFLAITRDMTTLDYRADLDPRARGTDESDSGTLKADLVINTSCEHLDDFRRWYERVPRGTLMVLQSNNFFSCEEHVNCVPDLAAFRLQAPMNPLLSASSLALKRYTRFMLIGHR